MIWAIIGPLVIVELIRRFRSGAQVTTLFRQSWWYWLLSLLMLPIMVVQLLNPTISKQAGTQPLDIIWGHFALASPFAHVDGFMAQLPFSVAGVVMALAMALGVAVVLADQSTVRAGRVGLLLALASSILTPIFVGSSERFMLTYIVTPMIFAGIGIHWLLRRPNLSQAALACTLATFIVLRIGWPEDPYVRVLWDETDYRPIAQRLKLELGPGDVWCAHPYVRANCLYHLGPFPEPVMPLSEWEFEEFLAGLPRPNQKALIFTRTAIVQRYPILRDATQWTYFNGFALIAVPSSHATPADPQP
jgi:hypothetical protein